MQNSLQYSDGRVEIVDVPKAFSVGDVVAVTHRRDGGVVVQRVTPLAVDTVPGIIDVNMGTVPAYTYIGVWFRFKHHITSGGGARIYTAIFNEGGEYPQTFTYTGDSSGWLQGKHPYYAGTYRWSSDRACKFVIKAMDLVSGDYIRFDYVIFHPYADYYPGQLLPDGSFESGSFGDGVTQWSKNEGGKVRIINTDAYDGSYCCEFYG